MTHSSISTDTMYRLLVQGVTDYAIYMLSLDGIVSNWNAGAQRFKGYSADEIVGQHVSTFYTAEDRANELPRLALETAMTQGRFESQGYRLRKDGTTFWAHVVIDLVRDESGRAIGFAKITRDLTDQRENEERVREQERSFRLLIQSVTEYAIYMLDRDGIISNWNAGAERAKGYTAAEIVGQHFSHFYTPEDRQVGLPQRALATAIARGKFEGEGWRLRKDGSRFWAHVVLDTIFDDDGKHIGFAKITRDMTKSKQQIENLNRMKENLDLALTNMSQGLCLFDGREQLVLCNQRFHDILGLDPTSLQAGSTYVDLLWRLHSESEGDPTLIAKRVQDDRHRHLEKLRTSTGDIHLEEVWKDRTIAVHHRSLAAGGWVTTLEDVTERKRIEHRIVHLAHHDSLTQLPNRASFRRRIQECLQTRTACSLLYMDLDRFKPINDTLGHPAGDRVLQVVAERIGTQLRKNDVGARLGGDEFAVLLVGCESKTDAAGVADRLIREIARPIEIDNVEVSVGLSVGIAYGSPGGVGCDLLLRNADLALYAAKQDGRGRHREYQAGMEKQLEERRQLELDLRAALSQEEFFLHYQPIVDVERNVVTSFEALLRWNSPTRGTVAPVDFIPFAEEIGLMPEIGDWVLRTACREAASWDHCVGVSVNLSPTQFAVTNLLSRVESALSAAGLQPSRLELEVTETAMITDMAHAKVVLTAFRELGVQIAMDDFGTGYSSLSFLRNLPFTRIKIDRSFIQDLGKNPEALAIIRAVTSLCEGLGVSATAEGVETEEQLNILQKEGCVEAQGYLIKRPAEAAEAKKWLCSYNNQAGLNSRLRLLSA